MKVVIAGGTGSLGRRVADDMAERGHEVVILTRWAKGDIAHRQVEWNGRSQGPWVSQLDGAVLVNLAGELVDRRPTRRNIDLITTIGDVAVRGTETVRWPPRASPCEDETDGDE